MSNQPRSQSARKCYTKEDVRQAIIDFNQRGDPENVILTSTLTADLNSAKAEWEQIMELKRKEVMIAGGKIIVSPLYLPMLISGLSDIFFGAAKAEQSFREIFSRENGPFLYLASCKLMAPHQDGSGMVVHLEKAPSYDGLIR